MGANGGDILHANDRICAWLGYGNDELKARTLPEFLPMGQRLFWANHQVIAANIGGGAPEVSYDLRRADGDPFPALVTVEDFGDDTHLYVVYRAENRRKYERQLLEAKRAAEEAARFRTEFVNTVSHEIRTPIHAIVNMAGFLDGERMPRDQQEVLTQLRDASGYLLRLINDVLDLAKAEEKRTTVKVEPIDLRGLCEGLAATLEPSASAKGIALARDYDLPEPGAYELDGGKLAQVLSNLISNAIKFTDEGEVRLSARAESVPPSSGGETAGARLHFVVRDTGPGVAPEEAERIFEPFAQAGPQAGATGTTGLGLSISRRIVEAFGGELRLERTPGHGAAFSFAFEAAKASGPLAPVPRVAHGEPAESSQSLAGLRILHADDNATNRFIARRHLRGQRVDLHEAHDGLAAVEMARATRFDAVLLDIRMPRMGGIDAAREIRRDPTYANVPVIAISAGSLRLDPTHARRLFDGYLAKPYTARQLIDLLTDQIVARGDAGDTVTSTRSSTAGAPADAPPAPAPTGGESAAGRSPTIDFTSLREEFADEDEREEYVEFVTVMRDDLAGAAPQFVAAVRDGDVAHVADERHRLQTILRTLRPEPLTALVKGTSEPLRDTDRESAAEALAIAFADAINRLDGELGAQT